MLKSRSKIHFLMPALAFSLSCGLLATSSLAFAKDSAQNHLKQGLALEQEYKGREALAHYKQAYELGSADGALKIAELYQYGRAGISLDWYESFDWYNKCYDLKSGLCAYRIGKFYEIGIALKTRDYEESMDALKTGYDLSDYASAFKMAKDYENDVSGSQGYSREAFEWYKKAFDLDYAPAAFELGRIYENGSRFVKQDHKLALDYYQKGYDKGDVNCGYKIGTFYDRGIGGLEQNEATALEWYRKADTTDARVKIALYHLEGKGGLKQDVNQAITLLTKEETNSVTAALTLAAIYEEGLYGMDMDLKKALEQYKFGADAGDAKAQYKYGLYFEKGVAGVEKNHTTALYWFKKAASQDSDDPTAKSKLTNLEYIAAAQYKLAIFYQQGLGVLDNYYDKALEYCKKAADNGNKEAKKQLRNFN